MVDACCGRVGLVVYTHICICLLLFGGTTRLRNRAPSLLESLILKMRLEYIPFEVPVLYYIPTKLVRKETSLQRSSYCILVLTGINKVTSASVYK